MKFLQVRKRPFPPLQTLKLTLNYEFKTLDHIWVGNLFILLFRTSSSVTAKVSTILTSPFPLGFYQGPNETENLQRFKF